MILMSQTKSSLRNDILNELKLQREEVRLQHSRIIKDKLFSSAEFRTARTILFYASFDGEVDTWEMMQQAQRLNKTIVLPAISKGQKQIIPSRVSNLNQELATGPYGIKQPREPLSPVALEDIELVVVPAVAFDKKGNRLGRGEGYYDRLLKQIPPQTPTLGLAFPFQILDELPQLAVHDCPVKKVITV